MAMPERDEDAYAQLKFRVKERLRAALEQAAKQRGISMNAEIVLRLEQSFERQSELKINLDELRSRLNAVVANLAELSRLTKDKAISSRILGALITTAAVIGDTYPPLTEADYERHAAMRRELEEQDK
jgi:Arc-like DNA binding domain